VRIKVGDMIRLRNHGHEEVNFLVTSYEPYMDAYQVKCCGEWDESPMPTRIVESEKGPMVIAVSGEAL
jgi:hypothetical protein